MHRLVAATAITAALVVFGIAPAWARCYGTNCRIVTRTVPVYKRVLVGHKRVRTTVCQPGAGGQCPPCPSPKPFGSRYPGR